MKMARVCDVVYGTKFERGGDVHILFDVVDKNNRAYDYGTWRSLNLNNNGLYMYRYDAKINLHWWEAIENPTNIEIMQAHEDGAEIEYNRKYDHDNKWCSCVSPVYYDTFHYTYRIKPSTHIIKIDDKEIELSEECYNKLKESLV